MKVYIEGLELEGRSLSVSKKALCGCPSEGQNLKLII